MTVAKIISDPADSVIDYECPKCGMIYSLEPDAGRIVCECNEELICDVMTSLETMQISDEFLGG